MTTTTRRTGQLIREVKIRPDQIAEAKRKAEDMGILNNSILEGKGSVYGFLGEILFAEAMDISADNTFNYDMVLDGIKIEVKTKHCTSPPRPEYECSVAAFNTKQECDFYVFVRVMKDFENDRRAWILGKKRKADYLGEATFHRKGDEDPNSSLDPKFKFTADCYNMKISDLMPIIYPERDEVMLEAYAKYLLMPLCKFTDPSSEDSIIYRKGYVEITGRGFDAPDHHRHYTLEEFQEKMNGDAEFNAFCEKLELPK